MKESAKNPGHSLASGCRPPVDYRPAGAWAQNRPRGLSPAADSGHDLN